MMIERQKDRTIVIHCDGCSNIIETETDEFAIAKIMMDEEGWTYLGDNRHHCVNCTEDMENF